MINNDLPDWLKSDNKSPCITKKHRDIKISAAKAFLELMTKINNNTYTYKTNKIDTRIRLFGVLAMIVLTALSKNFMFVVLMAACILVRIAMLSQENIRSLFKTIVPVFLFSVFVLLPACLSNHTQTTVLVLSKLLVCNSLVIILSLTAPYNEIISGLKIFALPDMLIFTLDLTLKHIVLLGKICSEMLSALKVRTIGESKEIAKSVWAIIGMLFFKTKQASIDTERAMECRCFNGKYSAKQKIHFSVLELIYVAFVIFCVVAFVYLEITQ